MAVQVGETGGAAVVLMQHDDPVLNNSVGAVHGGVSSMGLELVGSAAVNMDRAADPDRAAVHFRTASLRVNFLRPFHGGVEAHYLAKPLHVGRSSGVAEAQAIGARRPRGPRGATDCLPLSPREQLGLLLGLARGGLLGAWRPR